MDGKRAGWAGEASGLSSPSCSAPWLQRPTEAPAPRHHFGPWSPGHTHTPAHTHPIVLLHRLKSVSSGERQRTLPRALLSSFPLETRPSGCSFIPGAGAVGSRKSSWQEEWGRTAIPLQLSAAGPGCFHRGRWPLSPPRETAGSLRPSRPSPGDQGPAHARRLPSPGQPQSRALPATATPQE